MRTLNVLLALAVSFGIAFLVAEIGLRLLGFGPPALNTEFDSALGWRKRANTTIERKTDEYDVTIRTDALGLRDDFEDTNAKAPDGVFRVLCLGDSFVLGYTVDRKDLFVDQLEGAWSEEGRRVDVVNAGTQGYSTDQSLLWLQEHGSEFDPDLVIHFAYENDIWWNASSKYLGEAKPMFDENGELATGDLPVRAERGWFGSTAVGNLFRKKPRMEFMDGTSAGRISVEMSSRLPVPPESTVAAEARTRMLLGKMAEAARGLGATFAVCPLPSRELVAGTERAGQDYARPYEFFVEASRAADAKLIEPLAALRAAKEAGDEPYYGRDFHLNADGNRILAKAVYEACDAQALVPARAESVQAAVPGEGAGEGAGPASSGGSPRWPYWFAGLWAILGTLYSRTYRDETALASYLKVGALLAVVFATAIGVTTLVGSLPPQTGKLVLLALVFGILSFVAVKLGDRIGTIAELLKAFTLRGHWYLMPLLSVLLTVGSLLVVAASSPLVAPFIYTLF